MKTPLTSTLLLALLASPLVRAQSADNFDPAEPAVAKAKIENSGEPADPSELITLASRYVGINLASYTQTLASSFAINSRSTDPFGRSQDPNAKVPEKRRIHVPRTDKPAPETLFVDIIAAIPVTAVIPSQRSFLSGQRQFHVGDRIKLNIGKPDLLPVHVVAINRNTITFRNGVTNEQVERTLSIMPVGMRRGANERPAGLVPTGSNAPLNITPTNTLSSSR